VDARRYQKVKSLLADALERPPAGRRAFLASACGDDAALLAEVESLLEYEADDRFLEPKGQGPLAVETGTTESTTEVTCTDLDPLIGRTVSNYRVLRRLGTGGMGVVYLAEDLRLGRRAALKFLTPEMTVAREAEARFTREARAGALLDHPNICTLFGIEHTPDGRIFLAMAYYDGETLKQRLTRGPLAIADAIDIARQTADGLAAAHEVGIIHRDIKPGNIMVTGGRVKILDFGIAKLADQASLTLPGAALGTAAYVSPEQAAGGQVDHRTDVWALGVVTYEMLTGQRPFDVRRLSAMPAAARAKPESARKLRPEVPEALDAIVFRALAPDPDQRYASIRDFAVALAAAKLPLSATSAPTHVIEPAPVPPVQDDEGLTTRPIALAPLQQAIALAPRDPRPRAALVRGCFLLASADCTVQRSELARLAREELRRAQSLDPGSPDVQWAAAAVAFYLDRSPDSAADLLRRAVAARPGEAELWLLLAECLIASGDIDEAVLMAAEGAERHAGSAASLRRAGRVLHYARDFRAAARMMRAALEIAPDSATGRLDLALTLAKQPDMPAAVAECDRALVWQEGHASVAAAIGSAAHAQGNAVRHASAGRYLRMLQQRAPVSSCCFQLLDTGFGNTGRPLEYLENFDPRSGLGRFLGFHFIEGAVSGFVDSLGLIVYLGIDPAFDFIYDAPGVRQLLHAMTSRSGHPAS
jgi:tetratricopeptide (TPR) repeat protein